MALDDQPGTPGWWLTHLAKKLDREQQQYDLYEGYYAGDQPLAFATSKFRDNFGRLFTSFADNWTQIVVDAVEERLNVEGFRLGIDQQGDQDAWDVWQRNQLDADSQLVHTEALVKGCGYVTVWPDDDLQVAITAESAAQVTVAYVPGSRRQRAAALKRWIDEDGRLYATVFLPSQVFKFQSTRPVPLAVQQPTTDPRQPSGGWSPMPASQPAGVTWERREVANEPWPLNNPLGVVPVVPLINRPRLLGMGQSEIAQVLPIQDSVNKLVADMLVASEFAAYRQRWATGLEIPRDPETNEPVEPFKHAVDRLWIANPPKDNTGRPAGQVSMGEFSPTDLSNYVQAIELLVQHIASQTRTPPHYFALRGQFPSGESIKSAETGLVAKARRKMRHFGEAWEEVIRLAFQVLDDPRGKITDGEIIWGDPESRTESEHVDAVIKMKAVDVPNQLLWELLDFSPQQIERIIKLRAQEPAVDRVEPIPTEAINVRV